MPAKKTAAVPASAKGQPVQRRANPSRPFEEVWECTVDGRISMAVDNQRGGVQDITVKGKGQILRITQIDREMVEEVVRDPANNPFRNGALVRVDSGAAKRTDVSNDELTDDDLGDIFNLDNDDFTNLVPTLSEVNVRRLKAMAADVDARHAQIEFLNEHIAATWPIGGSMPTYDEMQPGGVAARL